MGSTPASVARAVDWRSAKSPGFLSTAYFRPFIASAAVLSFARLAWFHNRFLTRSRQSVIQETMWNESGTRSAFGQYPATDESIHLAPSPVTILMEARCSGVNSSKNRSRTCLPYPSCAQITRLCSWSTTTVMYVWPFLWLVSSTPIAVSPSNMHGMPDSSRPATRPAMSPAVLHATCRKPLTVFLLATVISHVHSISKSRVNRMPGSAHGTRDTTTPCTRHSTRGAGPTSSTR